MNNIERSDVAEVFHGYPASMRKKLMRLRQLVLEVASETEGVEDLQETLKWGEPSYLTKGGSTVRMGWKKSEPDQYALYFHCKTTLVDTFKVLYSEIFRFEGNRAIIFKTGDEIPVNEVKHCVYLSLTYHHKKHLPMLGAR